VAVCVWSHGRAEGPVVLPGQDNALVKNCSALGGRTVGPSAHQRTAKISRCARGSALLVPDVAGAYNLMVVFRLQLSSQLVIPPPHSAKKETKE